MTLSNKIVYSILLLLFCTITSCKSQVDVYDGFETSELSKIWSKNRMVKDPVIDQENVKTTSYFDYDHFITDGLIAYYPFNGNADDSIGNGLDGMANRVSYGPDRFNQPNRACYFNGIKSYFKIDNSELFNGNNYTICFWYSADLTNTLPQSIISKSDTARYGFTLGISNQTKFSDLNFTFEVLMAMLPDDKILQLKMPQRMIKELKCLHFSWFRI